MSPVDLVTCAAARPGVRRAGLPRLSGSADAGPAALDWQAGTLRVTHGVKRVKDRDVSSGRRTRLVVSELKTPKSRRTLVLTPELASRFRQHRARQAGERIGEGKKGEV